MAEFGRAALVVTLGLCVYATIAGAYAASRRRRRLAQSARNALIAAFGSTVVAAAVLAAGFLRSDFSLTYVADHSNRSLGGPYKLSAFWGGQEGSLLLWLLILTGYAALAVWVNRNRLAGRILNVPQFEAQAARVRVSRRLPDHLADERDRSRLALQLARCERGGSATRNRGVEEEDCEHRRDREGDDEPCRRALPGHG